ncbi:hemicentin-1-like isoform X2 [Montipora foliosa]
MLEFNDLVTNRILVRHVIKTMTIPSPDVCEVNCFVEAGCVSFNVVLLNDGSLECQLSDSDHRGHSNDMIYQAEATYTSVVNPCSSDPSPCPMNSRCQAGYTTKGYRCLCKHGFTGENCDDVVPVLVSASPKNVSSKQGEQVTFECSATGALNPAFTWKRFQRDLPASRAEVIGGRLTIHNVTMADSGLYLCNATNSNNTASVELIVVPVLVSAFPKNISTQRGQHVTFTCSATGASNPVFSWKKMKGNLPASRSVVNGENLTIYNVTTDDSGFYVCNATNSINTGSVELRVYCSLVAIKKPTPSDTVYVRQALKLSCTSSIGATLSWMYNGTNTLPLEFLMGKQGLLLIPSLKKNHTGNFSCVSGNSLLWNITIDVKYPNTCTMQRQICDVSDHYVIDPDDDQGRAPFSVYCNMTDKEGVGVTVVRHDSEGRILVHGFDPEGSYSRDVQYVGTSLPQIERLIEISAKCEQFIKFECFHVRIFGNGLLFAWWVSRDGAKMTYWYGANEAIEGCACSVTSSCVDPAKLCNCDINDKNWREDSGLLTNKTHLPVTQLRFGDTGARIEKGYHTLGSFKCYGTK